MNVDFLIRITKFGFWGPFSALIQIICSYIFFEFVGIHSQISFVLAVIVTTHINYFFGCKYIFKKGMSFFTYKRFMSSSGLSRILDIIIFYLIGLKLTYSFQITLATLLGAALRFGLYEYFVFNKQNISK